MQPITSELLSIDVNGHLCKLAHNSHRSHHHYPVELIRSALERGATKIMVTINREKIEIQDNGEGIGQQRLEQLMTLMDPAHPPEDRENAINSFYSPIGIGLLAMFTPSPSVIIIDDASGHLSLRIHYNGRLEVAPEPEIPGGSRIEIIRASTGWEEEIAVIKDYCRAVEQEIILNRKPLEKEPVIQHPIASAFINSTKYFKTSHISVTQEGDICKIWLTHQAIPWKLKTFPSIDGFIFDAVIETEKELTLAVTGQLSAAAANLYRWLCKRYDEYPQSYRERIEDLLFKHNRLTGDDSLLESFSPFHLLGSSNKYNLKEIRHEVSVHGLPVLQARYAPRFVHMGGKENKILVLTPKQIDFLCNHHHLPLRLIVPIRKEGKLRQQLAGAGRRFKEILRRLLPRHGKILRPEELNPDEKTFLTTLDKFLSGNGDKKKLEAVIIDSRGLLPSYKKMNQLKDYLSNAPDQTMYIARHHPLVKQAVKAVTINPANIELVLPVLGIDAFNSKVFY